MSDDTTFIVFIDALDPNDLERADFFNRTFGGIVDPGTPKVTPSIMSEVYTGESAAENGMARIHTEGEDPDRPDSSTIMEELVQEDGVSVLNLYMPYCIPQNPNADGYAGIGTSAQSQSVTPQEMAGHLTIPGPAGDLVTERRHDVAFDYIVDHAVQTFTTARTLGSDFDYVFIGLRTVDSYCHFQYDCGSEGRHADVGQRYRDKLVEVIDIQLQELEPRGEVVWFSDHGAEPLDEVFRINKWLSDEGYLDYTIDQEFIDKAYDYNLLQRPDDPHQRRVENQHTFGTPGVQINEMKAGVFDAYDSGVTVHDESIVGELIEKLKELQYYKDVYHKSELYDEDAQYYDDICEIIPRRADNVFVSGNIHPDPIGMGWYRTGVHSETGCYGGTIGGDSGVKSPIEMNEYLNEVLS